MDSQTRAKFHRCGKDSQTAVDRTGVTCHKAVKEMSIRLIQLGHWDMVFMVFWVVVSNIFYFHPYLGKIPILTIIFFKGVGSTTN